MTEQRVGFAGLGIMGSRMAANLTAAGVPLTVWTHTPGKAATWAGEHGAFAVERPAELATCDVVITMLVDGDQVERVLLGDDGVASAARDGLLCVDMSTIGVAAAQRVGAALGDRGLRFMDAPVTGSSPKAEDGTLTIMAGGEASDLERLRPLFEVMGEVIVHAGPVGHGQAVKLVNNAVAAANTVTAGEALLAAHGMGVDLDALVEVMRAGSGASAMLALKAGPMREHDYTTLFKLEHMLKDVRLCLEELPFEAAARARSVLEEAEAKGLGEADFAALIEALESAAGRRL